MSVSHGSPEASLTFAADAREVLETLRKTLVDLVDALPQRVAHANDLRNNLELDYKLSWQVFTLIKAPNVLSVAGHVPGPVASRRLLKAVEAQGVDRATIDRTREAFDAFELLIGRHAKDRTAFASMAAAATGEPTAAVEIGLRHRRNIYRGYTHLTGVALGTQLRCNMVHPLPGSPNIIHCSIGALLDMTRFRVDTPVLVDRTYMIQKDASSPPPFSLLDPQAGRELGVPIIRQFCSDPLPTFRTGKTADGVGWTEVIGGEVGERGALDLVFGDYLLDVPLTPSDTGEGFIFGHRSMVRFPSRRKVMDILIHRGRFGRLDPTLTFYQDPAVFSPSDYHISAMKLDLPERIRFCGRAPQAIEASGIPRYFDWADWACRQLKLNLDDFDVYRVELDFPPMQAVIDIMFHCAR